jgi:hypothetical protein
MGRAITVVAGEELAAILKGRRHWRAGRIVYVSDRWAGLGEVLPDLTAR